MRMMGGRAEIETRAPFKSVKEAVMLFGERVLVGEIYAPMLQQQQMREQGSSVEGELKEEIEEAKQRLEEAREESKLMAYSIKSLKEELQHTKKELQEVKARELKLLMKHRETEINETKTKKELQTKRYVQFASPPRLILNKHADDDEAPPPPPPPHAPSLNKPKKKPLGPLIRWLFARNNPTRHQLSHS